MNQKLPRRHFYNTMQSPYFQGEEYKNSSMGQCEIKIENLFKKLISRILFFKKSN